MKTIRPLLVLGTLALTMVTLGIVAQAPPRPSSETEQDPAAYWDGLYRRPETSYVREANAFLGHALDRIERERLCPDKKALDVAMGEGRNALYLAERGFSASGLDISPVAIEHARSAAKAKGLTLETIEADVFKHDYGIERFDFVTLIYFNPAVKVLDRLKAAVKPGGLILIEGQGDRHTGGGPPTWSRFHPNQLLTALDGWRILEYQDGLFPCDWNQGKPTHVVRVLAQKPGTAKPAAPSRK